MCPKSFWFCDDDGRLLLAYPMSDCARFEITSSIEVGRVGVALTSVRAELLAGVVCRTVAAAFVSIVVGINQISCLVRITLQSGCVTLKSISENGG